MMLQNLTELQAKAIILGVVGLSLIGCVWIYGHKQYLDGKAEVQMAWDADSARNRAIYEQQVADARKQEAIANEKTRKLQSQYNQDVSILANRLRDYGLRDARIVQGQAGVQVAGDTASGLSGSSKGTGGTDATVKEQASSRLSVSFSDTMSDTLQCSKLQEWVRAQGM